MKSTAPGRAAPTPFALHAIAAALAGIGLMSSVSAFAQESSAGADAAAASVQNTVLVSGQRQAAQSAQAIKQNAEQVVDSIVAEDIGKFPDKNVAELLGRITGVQTVRENGEAGRIVIRGLGGVTTLINGREMFTAASRSLNLTDVPVSMLQRVDVYKSQGPDMVEGGTSGVIDVRTFRPFDFKGAQTAVNARAEHRDKAGKTDPQVGGLLSNRWKTDFGEVGLLGGLSYQRGRYHDEVAWAGQPTTYTLPAGVQGADGNGRVMTTGDRKRLAANLSAQWRPNRDMEFYAEGFSTKIDHDSQSVFFVGGFPINNPASTVTTMSAGGKQYLDTISNPSDTSLVLSSTQARRDWSRGSQGAIGGSWDVAPTVRLSTEYVRTVSTYRQENPILDSIYTAAHPVVGGTRDGGGYVDYPGTDLTDPSKWTMIALYDNHNHSNGAANDWRGDVAWSPENMGILKELSGGLRWAPRDAAYAHELGNYRPATITGLAPSSIPGLSCLSPAIHGNYGVNQYYAACMDTLLDNTGAVRQAILGTSAGLPDDPLSYYTDKETTNAIYGKARIGFDAFGIPVDGSLGVRVVRTKQSIQGNSRAGTGPVTPISVASSNTDVLPTLNLRAHFRQDLVGRLVAGKAIERAAFGDYNPGMVLGSVTTTNGNPPTGTAGNPNLKPQEAKNVDVALEWYFSKDGSLTGTAFQHEFKNYLRRRDAIETINGQNYLVSRPYNTDTAKLYGFEAAYQQFFPQLPGWLGGLGMQLNATYMNGGMTEPDGSRNTFPGMSKTAYNLVGLYERGPWSARVAYSWRDEFVDTYNYRGLGVNLIVAPIKTLDASLSYKITEALVLTLDGSNLLNQAYHDYHGVPELPRDVRRYDRVVGLALRWKH
jgi:iron complex outermembrane receptor protein